ncbi:alpha-(1-_3)-arabinofuranosyltransferase domain-containing protein [Janibacter corallicola]|uniref:alpha-(1->3)-arabinofuranosyltransferase domain-containing protein n=1 Tax=Janibacter corallicola TaxID=415212 RepID=UPI0012EEA906|nr:alpha-(1->3)-arabinofuranosyltransferase family protein [Janibacter corallicola]
MEPAPPAAAAMTGQEAPVELARQRLQRLTATLVVAVLPWLVAPGTLQPDTKTALVLAPARYLQRALWAWSDHTGIGELQNQAYGYLWPMGPFFLAGDVAGLPGWVVQRGWWTLLLVLAFLGAERLARRLAGLAPVPALLTGAVFALSPRVLTVLAEISVEVWPYALAPWLVLAAERAVRPGARAADRRRAAVATGLLTACLGGVNATVSLVALVPAALWVLTAPRGRARVRALAWWLLGALLGGLWWLGPLVVLGGYAYPFLDHIELASTTTAVASVTNVLRGADHWIAYILTDGEHPTWQSGWVLAQSVTAILATCALAGLGLAGLLRRRAAEREVGEPEGLESVEVADAGPGRLTRWALVLVLLGVVTMSVGRSGAASGPFAETVQGWLDGPLAPLRNVHKADLLVRLPIALGAGLLAHWATRTTRGPGPVVRQVVVTGLVLALVGSLAPVWLGRVGDAWASRGIPPAWHQMADRVDAAAARDGGTTLVLPGARTADFTWGRTTDEPLTALASSPVLVRAAAPLGHPGATRILDHVDELVTTGRSQPQLAGRLRRLGVSRVVVRGGLSPDVGAGDPTTTAATLAHSRGLTRTWSTGSGNQRLSLWRVDQPAEPATLVPREGVVPVAAAPEGWSTMVATGVLDPDAVTVLSGGREAEVRTDSLRWQALNSGKPSTVAHGPTLPADDDRPAVVGTRDFAPGGERTARTTRVWRGLAGLDVTSSGADPFARQWHGAGSGPASLVDDDGRTAWVSGDGEATQRITLVLDEAARPSAALVHEAIGEGLGRITDVRIGGTHGHRIKGTATWRVPLDEVRRREVTIVVHGKPGDSGGEALPIGVRQVDLVGGPDLGTALSVPKGDGAVVIRRDPRGDADLTKGEDPADLVRAPGPTSRSSVSARVRLQPGEAAQDLLAAPWSLQGSTEPAPEDAGEDMEQWPVAALDGDPATGWRPQSGVDRPVLAIDLGAPEQVGRIELDRAVGPVTVETDHGRRVVPNGRTIDVPGPATRHLELTFTRPPGRADWTVPDLTLPGVEGPGGRVHLDCGEAGQVAREAGTVDLALAADRADLAAGEAVSATACGELPAGSGDVTARSVPGLVPQTVVLQPRGWSATEVEAQPVGSRRHHAGSWTFDVDAEERSLLVLTQGANPGWVATTEDGTELDRVTVDGWRQAFVVPGGTSGEVDVDFAPGRWHQGALAAGAGAVLLLLLWAAGGWLVRRRRVEDVADEQRPVEAPDQAEERGGAGSLVLGCALAALAGVLVAGWTGLVAAMVGALVPGRWRAPVVALVLAGAGIALTVLGTADRQSAGAWVSQGLGALTLGLLAAALVRPGHGGHGSAADAPPGSTTGDPDPGSAP